MSQVRVWFITGTSTGFGRVLAELVLEKGEIVVATARKPSTLDDLVAKYPRDRLLTLALDVTREEDVTAGFARAVDVFGRIDVVVSNAGYGLMGEFESIPEAAARAVFETNFWGAARVTREALRVFRETNPAGCGGLLLQVSSALGLGPMPALSYYSASKHALEGLTKTLVQELDPAWGIKVVLIEPGWFRTSVVSNVQWSDAHRAYNNPELPTSRFRATWDNFMPAGDTRRAVEAFYRVAALPDPPLHLPLGREALVAMTDQNAEWKQVVEAYGAWSKDIEAAD